MTVLDPLRRGRSPAGTAREHEEQHEREQQIELVFNAKRPGVRKRGATMEADVLDGDKEFPERRHFRILAPRWQEEINAEDDEIGRQDAQGASREETPKGDALIGRERGEQLAADQVSAKDEEKIDTDPAEAINAAGQFESEKRRVINDDNNDGKRTEKIETRLAFAISKARIDSEPEWHFGFAHRIADART